MGIDRETQIMLERLKIVGIIIFLIANCFIFYRLKPLMATQFEWFNTFELISIPSAIIVISLSAIVILSLFAGYLSRYGICALYMGFIYTFIPNKSIGWLLLFFLFSLIVFSVWMFFTRYTNIPVNKREYITFTSFGALPCIILIFLGMLMNNIPLVYCILFAILITGIIAVSMWFIKKLFVYLYWQRHQPEQPREKEEKQEQQKEEEKQEQEEQSQERTQLENALALYMFDDIKDVTESELKKQRNRLVKMYHPDNSDASERYVQKINEAYEIIKSNMMKE